MAGSQPHKSGHQGATNSGDLPSYYISSSLLDVRSGPNGNGLPGTQTPRGRNQAMTPTASLGLPPQPSGRAQSPRLITTNGDLTGRGTPILPEKRRSGTYSHHRQTSIVQGVPQHSRNGSFNNNNNNNNNSSALAHRSPQTPSGMQNASNTDSRGHSATSYDTVDYHSPDISSTSTAVGSLRSYSTSSTLSENHSHTNSENNGIHYVASARTDRSTGSKPRREHGRNPSKPSGELKSVGEFALHHLFNSYIRKADLKIKQCLVIPEAALRIEDFCGPGVDPDFDAILSSLGHIARQAPKSLVDTVMQWRRSKSDALHDARAQWDKCRHIAPANRILSPRSQNEASANSLDIGVQSVDDIASYALQAGFDKGFQVEAATSLYIYLACRVLLEVYQQSDLKSITLQMDDKLQDLMFDQLQRLDPDKVATSPYARSNWMIYSQLLGVMSGVNFLNVSQRFIKILQAVQEDASPRTATAKEPEARLELLVRAMTNLSIKSQTETQWKDSCEFMYNLGRFFISSHGQPIKHAYCQVLEALVFPIAATGVPPMSLQKWKEFLGMMNQRLGQMLVKPRHWQEAFPLSILLLCASPTETFASQWISNITSLQSKLKDRATRSCALHAICRLVWIYLNRINEPMSTILRKLEDVVKMVFPSGKKASVSIEPSFAEPLIELIRIIGFRNPDFCLKAIIFPLINSDLFASGKDIRVEQLEPERIVIGIRAYLAVISAVENADSSRPSFPDFQSLSRMQDTMNEPAAMGSHHQYGHRRNASKLPEDRSMKPVTLSKLNDNTRAYHAKFCEILGKITLICDNAFGGQAVLDEKFNLGAPAPKTPITDSFSFGRKEDHFSTTDQKQVFYELFHVAVQASPRCLSNYLPFNALINLLCTGTAHVQTNIAGSSAKSLKAIARQAHAEKVTIGFARYIFNFDVRYSTMSDEGMLGPGHIENTLQLYLELLQIWIEEVRQKTKSVSSDSPNEHSSTTRGMQLDLTSISAQVEEIESHGIFFLSSQSRCVRSFAVSVLRLVTEFDTALGRDNPRIIHILDGDILAVISPEDDRLTVAERSRLQKGNRKSLAQNTLIELCSSEGSYDSTLWFKIFPNLIRISFERCPVALTLGREIICARLLQMHNPITLLAEGSRGQSAITLDRTPGRHGATSADIVTEQWKLYLLMACTTLQNAGAQTQSQLASSQHARHSSKSASQGHEKINSARSLFAYVIPLLSAAPSSIRDAIVVSLGSININLYRTLLESLQYAVTTCNEEAKMMRSAAHQRTGSSPRRTRRTDRLRTEVTHVYRLTSKFLHEDDVLRDDWILSNLIKYTDDMRIFLSDAEVQNDWEFQTLRKHYCGLLEEVFEGINRTKDPARYMSFESRKAAFALMEDWCGYSPDQSQIVLREDNMKQSALNRHQETGDKTNVMAAIEIQKRDLRTAALSAMASLCGGPMVVVSDRARGTSVGFDFRRMLSWIDQIFGTLSDKMHAIGRRALLNLITHNKTYPKILEHALDMCYSAERPKAMESYFEVVTRILDEHEDYPLNFWKLLGAVLFMLGYEKSHIRWKSARLLRTIELRQQRSSKLQDFDISISDKTTAVYKLAQFEISKRLAKQHSELAFFVFSEFSLHYKNIHPDYQRNMIAAILPWIQVIHLQLDPNGGPTAQTYMLLANLLEITTKSSTAFHNEVQALWQALATGPHGGNVKVILDFAISLCTDKREQSFVDYAKQIVVFLSSTPAGQKVIEFLLLQITPRNMVHLDKPNPKIHTDVPPDILGLPYIADLGEALPIGVRQSGYSFGQVALILLVDLMVAPVSLSREQVPLLLQVCMALWDHYTPLVQEEAREMLVHLIHELVISSLEDDATTPSKTDIEDFVESIRQSKPTVVWKYQESNSQLTEKRGARVPESMTVVAHNVISIFELAYPGIHEQWAKTALTWASTCSVRHLACRSFQVFRCILSSLDLPMLADMLVRLSNTISDTGSEVQSFAMEILITLSTIIAALDAADLLKYPQLFWATCACLNTANESEFLESLDMLDMLLLKMNLTDPAVVKILEEAKPSRWDGPFSGFVEYVYRGLRSIDALPKTVELINNTALLPNISLVGDHSRFLFGILANLPYFLHAFEEDGFQKPLQRTAQMYIRGAEEMESYQEIVAVLNSFLSFHYSSSKEFLRDLAASIKKSTPPEWEGRMLTFLMGLLTNRESWFKLCVLDALCAIIPSIDMRRHEIAMHGSDLISPLLRLLQTEYCPRALEVMDLIMTMNATPMERHHIRMSMISSSSKSIRKEYEQVESLYGIPEESGWSVPVPGVLSNNTRANVNYVFHSCVNTEVTIADTTPTLEIEFDHEDFHNGPYSHVERPEGILEDHRGEPALDVTTQDSPAGDLGSKLDSLDDFFDDDATADDAYLHRYSDITITAGYTAHSDEAADLYDQQTAPLLSRTLGRTGSVTFLHSPYMSDSRPPARDVIALSSPGLPPAPPPKSSFNSRSATSTSQPFPIGEGEALSDAEHEEEVFSDDERSTGHRGSGPTASIYETMVRRTKSTSKKIGHAGRELRQGNLLRGSGRARSKSQAPHSPEVPKVPEAFLQSVKLPDF